MPKNAQTAVQLYSCHTLVRLCSKSFKRGFSSMWTGSFQMYKLDFRKAEEPEIKLPTYAGSLEKTREFQRNICFIDYAKAFVWITTNCGKFLKRRECQATLPDSWEMYMQVKKQQLELDMEQWNDSELGKEYIKAVYCHPACLTYMRSTSYKMLGWMKHKLQSDCWERYQ